MRFEQNENEQEHVEICVFTVSLFRGAVLTMSGVQALMKNWSPENANQINQAFLRLKGNGCCCLKIQVLAHSQGAKVLERAASVLPKDVRRVMYVTTIGGQTAISKKLGFAGVDNFSNRTGCINRDWVSVIGNYNPMRIPTAVLGMEAGWTRTHPHVGNWMEHSYQPYYACLVHSLPLNGPCIPIK